MKIYIAAYPVGIGTIFFSMSLDDAILHEQEMIELLALVRGTVERIDPSHKTELAMEWKGGVVQLGSIFDVCRWVRQELMECYSVPETKAIGDIEFVYPILYVGEVGHCETATDIITRHSKSIAGLVNLWIADSQWLKHMEVQKVVEADIHPFEYGLTCVSSTSTVELHPTNLAKVAEAEGMALEDHHFQEMVFLACVCETPVAQLYALRLYDAELTEVLQQIGFSPVAIMNPLLLGQLFYRAVRLAILRRELARAVNQFRSIRFTRKAYMARTIKLYQAEFAIAALAADVDNKLGTIDGIVSSTFAMVTALLALFLSAMATVLAVVQGISALVDLGWI